MYDIVFCSLPYLVTDRAPGAPALLKATTSAAGFKSVTIDLSLEFFINQCQSNIQIYEKLGSAFKPYELANNEASAAARQWVNNSIDAIKKYNPAVVGLSVFTFFQHKAAIMLASAIRSEMPGVKIIMGGYGLTVNSNGLLLSNSVKKIDLLKPFNQLVVEKRLADQVFLGTSLNEMVAYLVDLLGKGQLLTYSYAENDRLFDTLVPNFDDYKLDRYQWSEGPMLPVTGSRSCVRKCTFCDVPGQFGKFAFRPGDRIANEIISLSKRYNVNKFEFTDSLVNGSLKSFRDWLSQLAEYNNSVTDEMKVTWIGQYICRPQKDVPSDIYRLLVESGAKNLIIGVESGSNEVLKAMNKKMTVQDALDELSQFEQCGLQTSILLMTGFYNETWERFLETLEFVIKLQRFVAAGVVTGVSFGAPMYINEKMPIYNQADHLGIQLDPYNANNWSSKNDTTNTFVERTYRRLLVQLLIDRLGIPTHMPSILMLEQLIPRLNQYAESLNA